MQRTIIAMFLLNLKLEKRSNKIYKFFTEGKFADHFLRIEVIIFLFYSKPNLQLLGKIILSYLAVVTCSNAKYIIETVCNDIFSSTEKVKNTKNFETILTSF